MMMENDNNNNASNSKQTLGTGMSGNMETTAASASMSASMERNRDSNANKNTDGSKWNNMSMNNRSANDENESSLEMSMSPEENHPNPIQSEVSPRSVQMLMASSDSHMIPSPSTSTPTISTTSTSTVRVPQPVPVTTMTMATNERQQQPPLQPQPQPLQQSQSTHETIMDQPNISIPFLPISCGIQTTTENENIYKNNDTNTHPANTDSTIGTGTGTGITNHNNPTTTQTMSFITPQSFIDGNHHMSPNSSNLNTSSIHHHHNPYLHPKQVIERHNSDELLNDNENGTHIHNSNSNKKKDENHILLPFPTSSTTSQEQEQPQQQQQEEEKHRVEIGTSNTHHPITEESILPFALPCDIMTNNNTDMDGYSSSTYRNLNSVLDNNDTHATSSCTIHDDTNNNHIPPSNSLHDPFMNDPTIGTQHNNSIMNDNYGEDTHRCNINNTQNSLLDFNSSLHDPDPDMNEDDFVSSNIPELSNHKNPTDDQPYNYEYEHDYNYNYYNSSQLKNNTNQNQSMNFSKLMREADNQKSVSFASTTRGEMIHNPNLMLSSTTVGSLSQSIMNYNKRDIILRHMTKDSFQLSVQFLSTKVSVRDVVDMIANPDMLRFWCEPISALVVTDHKGRSSSSCVSGSGLTPPTRQENDHNQYPHHRHRYEEEYIYPDVEECDDDVIVPAAEDAVERKRKKALLEKRQEYDGEWIKASTPEIILPYAHTTFMDNCFKKVSTFLGFPAYGNVTMFIERNSAQVGFSLGPFKAGTMLSHKITVSEGDNGQGVILMDEVTVVTGEEEEEADGWVLCSCIGSVLDITKSWYQASLDGYIDQTKASLRNLVDLVEGGGEMNAYRSNRLGSIHNNEASFSDGNNIASQRVPLLT